MNLKTPVHKQSEATTAALEFRNKFQVSSSIDLATRTMQRDLIVEEFKEFVEANQQMHYMWAESRADCLKELADLVYVCYQFAMNMGWDLDEALYRVHASNLSKLGEDGKPIRREDGKVLKGPNYEPPTLTDLV
jgi:predicted HAD superfamily Cof-like phosphohydrolase